ncbi:hypothetical protein D3C87_1413440 [compost metagenome]
MEPDLFLDGARRQFPDFFRRGAMLRIGHHQIGRQTMGERAHFPRRSAGRRLARQGERTVARLADFSGQQVDVVDQVVGPHTPGVLVETHGPERNHLALGVGIQFGQCLEALGWHPGFLRGAFQGVGFDEGGELLEVDVGPGVRFVGIFGLHLQRIIGTQTVADVIGAFGEFGVLADKVFVDRAAFNDVIGDVVENEQVSLRLEYHRNVGQFKTAMFERREHGHFHIRLA